MPKNKTTQPHDMHHFKGWSMTRGEFIARFMERVPMHLPLPPEQQAPAQVIGCLEHEDGSGYSYIADSGRYELYIRFPSEANRKEGAHGYVRVYHDAPVCAAS